MKICFISPKAYPLFNTKIKSTFGGAEVQLTLLAKELAKEENLDINFIVADYEQKEIETFENIKIWKGFNFKDSPFKQKMNFLKVFNKVDADVYVQRTLRIESALIALYSFLKRKKLIYMVAHDSEVDGTHRFYKNYITKFFVKLNFYLANKIIVQNDYERKFLKGKRVRKKVVVLKKGLKLLKEKSGLNKKYDAIWIGRGRKYKRPEMFFKLAMQNENKKFLMICAKPTKGINYFMQLKKKCKNLKNVEFLDFVNNEDIYKYLSESKLYIFTSTKEGDWPMVVLEAAASKLPILSYDLNYDDLIDVYQGGILCKGDFNRMSSHFKDLVTNQEKRERMGGNAYRYIIDNHNIEVNARKFLDIIL